MFTCCVRTCLFYKTRECFWFCRPRLETSTPKPQRPINLVSLDAMPDAAVAAHAGASTCSGALCAAGKYGVAGATSASAAACTDCPAGSYSAETGSVVSASEAETGVCVCMNV